MTSTDYGQDILIDGLNVSNWDSPGVYESLRNGNVTAINATIATWHNFQETLEEIELWIGPSGASLHARLARYGDSVMQVETVDEQHQRSLDPDGEARGRGRGSYIRLILGY